MQVETIYKLIKLIGYISLTFSDWLLTSGNKFSVTPIEEMNKEELNACLKSFHQGGLSHAEDESDVKIFSVPESDKMPCENHKKLLVSLES